MTDPPEKPKLASIARCRLCSLGGVTNTNVISVATLKTPKVEDGDFLCLFHDHPTAIRYAGTKEGK